MGKRWRYWSAVVIVTMGFLMGRRGLPDIAPPRYPPGGNPDPSATTQVQMTSEKVVIRVFMNTDLEVVDAQVEAVFRMFNQGSQTEHLEVYFPAQCWGDVAIIPYLEAEVDGQPVPVRRASTPAGYHPPSGVEVRFRPRGAAQDGTLCPEWFVFPVTFPEGQRVLVRVRYPLQSFPAGYPAVQFRYFLATGRGWWGPIGKGSIILRLPYPARPENALVWADDEHFQEVYEGSDLRVSFINLEPTKEDNLVFTLILPSLWYPVFRAEQDLQTDPNDGEAWGRRALALKYILLRSGKFLGTAYQARLMPQVFESYEKAVTLLPEDPLWHLGYAELLWVCYSSTGTGIILPECTYYSPEEGLQRAIEETYQAYRLAPQDPQVQEKLQALASLMEPYVIVQEDGQVIFAALTPTPVWTATPTPTKTPTATLTLTPAPSATSTPHVPTAGNRRPTSTPTATAIETQDEPRPAPFGGTLCARGLIAWGLAGVLVWRYANWTVNRGPSSEERD